MSKYFILDSFKKIFFLCFCFNFFICLKCSNSEEQVIRNVSINLIPFYGKYRIDLDYLGYKFFIEHRITKPQEYFLNIKKNPTRIELETSLIFKSVDNKKLWRVPVVFSTESKYKCKCTSVFECEKIKILVHNCGMKNLLDFTPNV
jgi:hypothetical protein